MNKHVSTMTSEPLDPVTAPWQSIAQRLDAMTPSGNPHRREATRIPYITVHAFCDNPDIADVITSAAADRLMSRAHVTVQQGGIAAAAAFYQEKSTPQLIVIESRSTPEAFLSELDRLAERL